MADLIIKSSTGSGNNLLIQGADSSPAITIAETGTTTFAENATLSGTANNLGTVTAGTLASTVLGSNTCKPAFSVYSAATQTQMPHNAWHLVKFTTEHFDTDSAFRNDANSDFTVPSGKAGFYFFCAFLRFEAWAGNNGTHDTYAIEIRVDNVRVAASQINQEPDIGNNGIGITSVVELAVGGVVTIHGYSEHGSGSGSFIGVDKHTHFSGTYLGV